MREPSSIYLIAADAILVVHALFVVFVVGALIAVYAGRIRHWHWVRNRVFRLVHLAAVAVVAMQSWLGMICPLTLWEMALRERAGAATYSGAFIAHWIERMLYIEAPAEAFAAAYTVFGAMVAASWLVVPPRAAGSRGAAPPAATTSRCGAASGPPRGRHRAGDSRHGRRR